MNTATWRRIAAATFMLASPASAATDAATQIKDIRDFEAAVLDFLDRNIGPASSATAKEAAVAAASASASSAHP